MTVEDTNPDPPRERHPSTFTDYELDRLAGVSYVPYEDDEIATCYERGGIVWAVFKSGDIWVRGPLPDDHPLAQRD